MHAVWYHPYKFAKTQNTTLCVQGQAPIPLFAIASTSFHIFFSRWGNISLSTVLSPATKLLYFVKRFPGFSVWLVMGILGSSMGCFNDCGSSGRVAMVGESALVTVSSFASSCAFHFLLGSSLMHCSDPSEFLVSYWAHKRIDIYQIFPQQTGRQAGRGRELPLSAGNSAKLTFQRGIMSGRGGNKGRERLISKRLYQEYGDRIGFWFLTGYDLIST